ncbi:MAG: hypothetical protein LBB81_09190, partial [Treponema sp.]|nr:hypothetical protein [Treponema sp.]
MLFELASGDLENNSGFTCAHLTSKGADWVGREEVLESFLLMSIHRFIARVTSRDTMVDTSTVG